VEEAEEAGPAAAATAAQAATPARQRVNRRLDRVIVPPATDPPEMVAEAQRTGIK
jgi:hypothetical protein